MQFLSPDMLWLLLFVPVLVGAYILAQRRRARYALRFSSLAIVKDALDKRPGMRRHIPPLLFLCGIALMLFAAARPFGVVTLPKEQATVILAIDVSGSMRANDMKPTRLEAAKTAALAFITKQDAQTRLGVVSFSWNANVVQAPTTDRELARAAVERLVPQQSTAIGSGILTSLDAIFEKPRATPPSRNDVLAPATPTPTPVPRGNLTPASIILLTDGQNRTGPPPISAAQIAADRGVRVFTIGVGTVAGTTLQGSGGFGFRAVLDEDTLKRVAAITDAKYFHASDETALLTIYQNLAKGVVVTQEKEESTVLFTALAMLFLLIGGALSLFWFNRLP
ncbi:MAG: VWA domain-containing protein [Anaerolineales bacterium]|nr:VWA domain-containing protein [Anaerolineales bacterium]